MINIKDILTLSDDKKYLVVNKAKKNEEIYYLLVQEDELTNIKFCSESRVDDEIVLTEIEDENTIRELMLRFTKNSLLAFKEENTTN